MANFDPDTFFVSTLTNAELEEENSNGTAILSRRFTAHLHLGIKLVCGSKSGWIIEAENAWGIAFGNLAMHTPHTIPLEKAPNPSGPGIVATQFGSRRQKTVFWVGCSNGSGMARLAMPTFVAALCRMVGCSERELVVAPISANSFLCTNCSEVGSTYLLGCYRLKFQTDDCIVMVPPMQLAESEIPLRLGGKPHTVAWQDYVAFGSPKPLEMDGNLSIHGPVPATEAQVQTLGRCMIVEGCFATKFCTWCNETALNMQKCSRCRVARYCSVECQAQDWLDTHKDLCKQWPQDTQAARLAREQLQAATNRARRKTKAVLVKFQTT